MRQHGINLIDTRFSYSVRYGGDIYAHDSDSDIRRRLQPEIARFQRLLRHLQRIGCVNRMRSRLLNALNPFNHISIMGTVLNLGRFSGDFRYKVLKPRFVNFLMATNMFDMPASMFYRYPEFFDIEHATPMQTWERARDACTSIWRLPFGSESTWSGRCARCSGVPPALWWRIRLVVQRPLTMWSLRVMPTRR